MPSHNVLNEGQRSLVFEARFIFVGPNLMAFRLAQRGNLLFRKYRWDLGRRARGDYTCQGSQSYELDDHGVPTCSTPILPQICRAGVACYRLRSGIDQVLKRNS